MSYEAIEDAKDLQDIKKQKEEYKNKKIEMSTWEFGKGVKKKEKDKNHVRG